MDKDSILLERYDLERIAGIPDRQRTLEAQMAEIFEDTIYADTVSDSHDKSILYDEDLVLRLLEKLDQQINSGSATTEISIRHITISKPYDTLELKGHNQQARIVRVSSVRGTGSSVRTREFQKQDTYLWAITDPDQTKLEPENFGFGFVLSDPEAQGRTGAFFSVNTDPGDEAQTFCASMRISPEYKQTLLSEIREATIKLKDIAKWSKYHELPIEELEMSTFVINALRASGQIDVVAELVAMTEEDLKRIHLIADGSINKINGALRRRGLTLRSDDPDVIR